MAVATEDWSTYWAVVVAKKGSPTFDGTAEYFKGKKVICCQLASSGEFFVRSVYGDLPLDCDLKRAASHGAALRALSKGAADIAVVKNRVYAGMSKDPKNKDIFANIEIVGRHNGENPNGTLIVSKSVSVELRQKVKKALLDLESDTSTEAKKLNESLKVRRYIVTTTDDFMYTIPMLKSAGVTRDFNFSFDG
jgi:ABC-type amino acid transport substrate-binding protein